MFRRVLQAGLLGLACAQFALTNTKLAADEVEYLSKSKDGKSKSELRMRIRTKTDDNTLEMEIESHAATDKTKIDARTRFNVRDVFLYTDDNADGLLNAGENATAYDMSRQWGAITCTTAAPYNCSVCNSGGLPANALCFQFLATENAMTFGTHTVSPTTVKINMYWNPANVVNNPGRVALVGRFRSYSRFKARQQVGTNEEGQGSEDGSMVKWETRVYTPAGSSSEVKVGVYIPSSSGTAEGTETDSTDGSSMSYRQLQFNFNGAEAFTWDPDIIMPSTGALAAAPACALALLAFFF